MLIEDSIVRRHVEEYLNSKKLSTNYKGSEPKLNQQQTIELIEYIQSYTFMNVKPVIEHIKLEFKHLPGTIINCVLDNAK